ncbi:MAG: AAA family ATPase [Pseudomonadota bacterium]
MLTRIHIKNFKRFNDIEIELGKTVVLIGPNNSGKTTALQALALWEIGLKRCHEKQGTQKSVTINRRDLIATAYLYSRARRNHNGLSRIGRIET